MNGTSIVPLHVDDDPSFLDFVIRTVRGIAEFGDVPGLHIVHVDNWFGDNWLGFSGKTLGALGVTSSGAGLTVPAFKPSRIMSHRYVCRASAGDTFHESETSTALHLDQWSALNLRRRAADVLNGDMALWYSGKSEVNQRGALMAYLPCGSEYETWYAALTGDPQWRIEKTKGISRARLEELVL